MRRIGILLTLFMIIATITACGSGDDFEYNIAIAQHVEHPSLDATREGFLAALNDAGLVQGENMAVEYNSAQGDMTNNLSIAQKFAGEDYDLVYAIATPTAEAVVKAVKDSPVLFASVTDPLDAGLIDNLETPSGNVTGASDTNPLTTQLLMDFIAEHFPDVETVGIVINKGEANAVVMMQNAKEQLDKHGIKMVEAAVTNTSEVQQAAQSLVDRADAIFITLDNAVVDGVDTIIQLANEHKIPFFASDRDTVERGAFATVGFSYYEHGYQSGEMAVEILKNGKKPSELSVTFPQEFDLILNLKAAADQGIEVTDAMKATVEDEANIIE